VFLEGVFRKIERVLEGSRTRRIRRNLGPWTFDKTWRKTLKHAIFLGASVLLAHAFVAYFIPARELLGAVFRSPSEHLSAFFWVTAWTGILYFDYAWFREQTCLILCPYGRLQSSLIDGDTVVIGYDPGRGEPRSRVNDDGGDCVDCHRCVQVCPTGIDIRNGLQMECVGCANCIDACDEIMDKLHRPRGLIRYDSLDGFETGRRRSLVRPRVFVYAFLGLVGLGVFTGAVLVREPFEVKVLRARGMPYVLEGDRIRNLYTIRVQNKAAETKTFFVSPAAGTAGPAPEFLVPQPAVLVEGLGDAAVPVFAYVDRAGFTGSFPIEIAVTDSATGHRRIAEARFRGP
jgi:cytochrome c oxidase accessory protein FixG